MNILHEALSPTQIINMFSPKFGETLADSLWQIIEAGDKDLIDELEIYASENNLDVDLSNFNVTLKLPLAIKLFSLLKPSTTQQVDSSKTTNITIKFAPILYVISFFLQHHQLLPPDKQKFLSDFQKLKSASELNNWREQYEKNSDFFLDVMITKIMGDSPISPVYEDSEIKIYHLYNHVESRKIGGDTQWCVSSPTSGKEHFTSYANKMMELYAMVFYKEPEPQPKYLLAFVSKENYPNETEVQFDDNSFFWNYIKYLNKGEYLVNYFWDQVKKKTPIIGNKEGKESFQYIMDLVDSSKSALQEKDKILEVVRKNSSFFLTLHQISNIQDLDTALIQYFEKITKDFYELVFKGTPPQKIWKAIHDINLANYHPDASPISNIKNIVNDVKEEFEERFFPLENVNFSLENSISYVFEFKNRENKKPDTETTIEIMKNFLKYVHTKKIADEIIKYLENIDKVVEFNEFLKKEIIENADSRIEEIANEYDKYYNSLHDIYNIPLLKFLIYMEDFTEREYKRLVGKVINFYFNYDKNINEMMEIVKQAFQTMKGVIDEEKANTLKNLLLQKMNRKTGNIIDQTIMKRVVHAIFLELKYNFPINK